MINTIADYGRRWRFQFAPNKSQCIVFTQGNHRMHRINTDPEWVMGASEIPEARTVTHVGIQHSSNTTSAAAIESACRKGKGRISAILSTGLEGHTPNPLVTKILYHTIVIPSMLHGCELWYPTQTDLMKLERVHRGGVKRMQNMHPQTGTRESLGALGMHTLKAIMDKHKLCFFGRLANLPCTALAKKVFLFRLYSHILARPCRTTRGFISDSFRAAEDYGLTEYLERYWQTVEFPTKMEWKQIVKRAVSAKEESEWVSLHSHQPRSFRVHSTSSEPHKLWSLARKHPKHQKTLQKLVHLSTAPVKHSPKQCPTCDATTTDIVGHLVSSCVTFNNLRDSLADAATDKLGIRVMASVHQQPDERFTEIMLGADIVEDEIDPDIWEDYMITVAGLLYPLATLALKHVDFRR